MIFLYTNCPETVDAVGLQPTASIPFPQYGTPEGTRTPNIQNRNLTLYPLNYGRISLTLRYYSRISSACKGGIFPHAVVFSAGLPRPGEGKIRRKSPGFLYEGLIKSLPGFLSGLYETCRRSTRDFKCFFEISMTAFSPVEQRAETPRRRREAGEAVEAPRRRGAAYTAAPGQVM